MIDPYFGIDSYLSTDRMGIELTRVFTEMLAKILKVNAMRNQLNKLVLKLPESNFFSKILYESIEKKQINNEYDLNLIKNTLNLCSSILEVNPGNKNLLEPMLNKLELLVKLRIAFNKDIIEQFEMLSIKKEQPIQNTFKIKNNSEEPPNKITELSIVPSLNDIISDEEPFLRENITNGAYRSVEHYLDIQFRLLREDFIQPLRIGVKKLRVIIDYEKKLKKNFELNKQLTDKLIKEVNSVNIYFEIQMKSTVPTSSGIVYVMRLNNDNNKRKINWERSKRLMFGSLVCLSSDFFQENCLIGTICERDLKKLENEGAVYIKFDNNTQLKHNLPKLNETYIMIEASAYFESYKHVLESFVSFQRFGEEEFPFKSNLVYCDNQAMPMPDYLQDKNLDFRCLIDKKKKIIPDLNTGLNKYEYDYSSDYAKCINASNMLKWPSMEQFGFDQSQYSALKLALTNKLALIQGKKN
jgi:hypothetical protein